MRRFYLLGLALLGVLACSAAMTSSAFAVAEWLFNGAKFPSGEELLTTTTGELTLIHLAGLFTSEVRIKCSGIFDGIVLGGPGADSLGGEDLVTELLSLGEVKVELGKDLECTVTQTGSGGCEVLTPTETFVAPEHLPWLTKLTLMVVTGGSLYLDLFTEDTEGGAKPGLPAYFIECLVGGVKQEITCEGETSADLTLSGSELLGIFTDSELESEGLEGMCTTSGGILTENVALQLGEGVIAHAAGELDVSE
jgi:hypothetical protein